MRQDPTSDPAGQDDASYRKAASSDRGPPVKEADGAGGSAAEVRLVEQWYREHSEELHRFLSGVLRDPDLAWEAVQNTFRRALEVEALDSLQAAKAWLFKVGFHEAIGLRRKQGVDRRAVVRIGEGRRDVLEYGAEEPALAQVLTAEEIERLKERLSDLSPEQRWVVERRIYHEETFSLIARELGVPIGTVLTRMRLAMAKLQKWMGGTERGD